MAQARVTEFFNSKKRASDFQPSKRRKVARTLENESVLQQQPDTIKSPPVAARTRRGKSIIAPQRQQKAKTTRRQGSKNAIKSEDIDKIQDILSSKSVQGPESDILSETSAVCDDHNSTPPSTPTKRVAAENTSTTKRSRGSKAVRKDLLDEIIKTPEAYDFTKHAESDKVKDTRKKLILQPESPMPESLSPKQILKTQSVLKDKNSHKGKANAESTKEKSEKKEDSTKEEPEFDDTKQKVVEKTQGKSKKKQAIDPGQLRAQLSKTGKLAELQEKLAEYSKSVKKVKEARNKALQEEAKEKLEEEAREQEEQAKLQKPKEPVALKDVKVATKAPAYERFHHLVEPVPPSLTLPYKYKILDEMFKSVDTVVSMLYKRSETCTFSKLKGAVQKMLSKNFEEKNLGQIQTVYPNAYILRQEKGLPTHGYQDVQKGAYQLTVDPVLQSDDKYDKEGRPAFTADQVTKRKNHFYRCLLAIVKKYHKEFLSSLDRPLNVSDDKVTRWHPKFKLDEVPDIEAADLPKPPDMKKFTTAKEVLEEAKGKLNPRIQKALELISSPTKEKSDKPEKTDSSKEEKSAEKKEEGKGQLKGVSASLLERIRAKEVKQQEAAMTRNPAQEKRLNMMQRLPELCRILRSHFVTQKKPALVLDDAVNKLSQSYHSSLGIVETQKHVDLMVEILPEWIQILKVKSGTFIKIDRNKDINIIIEKLNKMQKT